MVDRLKDKVALITGAARGIGEAIAAAFVEEGAHVLLTDLAEEEGAALAAELGADFDRLDVREEADWVRIVDGLLERQGQLDVLVNNAGVTGFEQGPVRHDPEHAELAD